MDKVFALDRFRSRSEAGALLGEHLATLPLVSPVVLGLARGGVPVAFGVAKILSAPLDVLIVRKLGVPHNQEFAFGAISEEGVRVLNADVISMAGLSADDVDAVVARERAELARRVLQYRAGRPLTALEGHDVILVDDGLATGATALAAVETARRHHAKRVIVAVPVASPQAHFELSGVADEVVCLSIPDNFSAVGQFYDRFDQTTDQEVIELLASSAKHSR